jgi:RHS repeat-associated protein
MNARFLRLWFALLPAVLAAQTSPASATVDLPVELARLREASADFAPESATKESLLATRVFPRPLAVCGEPTPAENRALARALRAHLRQADRTNQTALADFVRDNPNSAYAPSLLVQLGDAYCTQARYSRALAAYQAAWFQSKGAREEAAWLVAMDAAAGYVKMLSRVGRRAELEAFFSDSDALRPMWGHAARKIEQAREGLGFMVHRPELSFRCGSLGLASLARASGRPSDTLRSLLDAPSPANGFSLAELEALAASAGLPCRAIFVAPAAPIPVPSVIHWKIGHYAAIVGRSGERYIVRDPTFGEGRDVHVTPANLREEASGYFLVSTTLPDQPGWSVPAAKTKADIRGRGQTTGNIDDATRKCDLEYPFCGRCDSGGPGGGPGGGGRGGGPWPNRRMAGYAIKTMLVSLVVRDTPAYYAPAYGPSMDFTLAYNERENNEINDSFGNFGPGWSFEWLTWINEENGGTDTAGFKLGAPGGGAVRYYEAAPPPGQASLSAPGFSGYAALGVGFPAFASAGEQTRGLVFGSGEEGGGAPPPRTFVSDYDQTSIERTMVGTDHVYRVTQPDGTVHEYAQPVGLSANRKVLLSKVTDPAGNAATLVYDTSARLQTITDATGAVTHFYYELTARPNRITRIQIPDGRQALFRYTAGGFLEEIEDMGGIISHLTYGDPAKPDRITKLNTPYGETAFAFGQSATFQDPSRYRWIEVRDPLGARERVEFNERENIGVPYAEQENLPAMPLRDLVLNARNSFVWSKKAFSLAPALAASDPASPVDTLALGEADYAQAHWLHWIHADLSQNNNEYLADDHLESEKRPGESRVWYNYPGQSLIDYSTSTGRDYGSILSHPAASFYTNNATFPGNSRQPSRIGRVVPDPSGAIDPVGGYDPTTGQQIPAPVLVSQIHSYAYNAKSHPTRYRDPEGREVRLTYAANQIDLVKVQRVVARPTDPADPDYDNPDAASWTYQTLAEIDWASGVPHRNHAVTDAARRTITYTYNAKGQLRTATNARNETTTYWYHPTGQGVTPATTLDPLAAGYLVRIDGPLAGATDTLHFTWDAQGRVRSFTDESGHTLVYSYNALDDLTRIDHPDTTYEEIEYDRIDPRIFRDRAGRLTVVDYDALRRPETITDPADRVTRLVWCGCGALEKLVDPAGRVTRFEYDVNGNLVRRHFEGDAPAGPVNTHEYGYDLAGRLATHLDPRGQRTTYRHTLDDRLAATIHTDATEPTPDTFLTFDAVFPRLSRIEDRLGGVMVSAIDFTYHPITAPVGTLGAGRLATVSGPLPAATVAYTYDELGRPAGRTLPGQSESWRRDALGRLDQITDPLGVLSLGYVGASGRLSTFSRPGGLAVALGYRPLNEDFVLETLAYRRPDQTVVSAQGYTQDHLLGRITAWAQTRSDGATDQWDFGYTPADELKSARRTGSNPPAGQPADHAYAYDLGGNRRGEARDATATAWTTNGRNQLVADAPALRVRANYNAAPAGNRAWLNGREFDLDSSHRLDTVLPVASGEQTLILRAEDADTGGVLRKSWQVTVPAFAPKRFDYDANGNLTRITQAGVVLRFHKWDARDRLIAWGSGTTVEGRFQYDSLGQRYRETDGANNVVRQWVWDGGARPLQERDAAGGVTRRYFGQGEMRKVGGSEVARYYARDHLGSVREVVDGNNVVMASYTFDPYGRRVKLAGTENYETGFTGHYYHAATGLYLTRFRAYDADTARWLSRDPIGEAGGVNLYGYVGGDPVNWIDPWGLAGTTVDSAAVQSPSTVAMIMDDVARIGGDPGILPSGGTATSVAVGGGFTGWISSVFDSIFNSTKEKCPLPEELRGKTKEEIDKLLKGKGWGSSPTRKRDGIKYPKPGTKESDQVRVMDGNPSDSNPVKRGPYARITEGGNPPTDPIPLAGNPTL